MRRMKFSEGCWVEARKGRLGQRGVRNHPFLLILLILPKSWKCKEAVPSSNLPRKKTKKSNAAWVEFVWKRRLGYRARNVTFL